MKDDPRSEPVQASKWVTRFAPLISRDGTVLDLASGRGRHTRYLRELGYRVVAIDRDASGLRDLANDDGVEIVEADLETERWPLEGRRFEGVVVTNYLYRPRLYALIESLNPGGILIYESFSQGHEKLGRPRNPDFLLRPAELLDVFAPHLSIIAYEYGIEARPRSAVRQRVCARRGLEPTKI